MIALPFLAVAQDTIPANLTRQSNYQTPPYPAPQFVQQGDSVTITGYTVANCAGTHLAIIKHKADSVFVSFCDTGALATCMGVVYSFKLTIRSLANDSVWIVGGQAFNLNAKLNDEATAEKWADAFYDASVECLKIKILSGSRLKYVSVYDAAGRLQLTIPKEQSSIDFSGFDKGVYLLDFVNTDNSHISKKILKTN